jgi:hypothetical protein
MQMSKRTSLATENKHTINMLYSLEIKFMLTKLKSMIKIIRFMIISIPFHSKEMISMTIYRWANMLIKECSLAQTVNTILKKFKIYKEQLDLRAIKEKISILNNYTSKIQILNLQEWLVWLKTNKICFTLISMKKISYIMTASYNLKNKDKTCN